jgi:hypothetical protein
VSSKGSQRPAPDLRSVPSRHAELPNDRGAVEREIARLERQLLNVKAELVRLKSLRGKAES